jgi:hypothetical protein
MGEINGLDTTEMPEVPEIPEVPETPEEPPEAPDTPADPHDGEGSGYDVVSGSDKLPSDTQPAPEVPEQPDDQITIHDPHHSPETLPSAETEPISIPNPEGGPKPPEGWHPGGPEGLG